jgi:hypothetical protein
MQKRPTASPRGGIRDPAQAPRRTQGRICWLWLAQLAASSLTGACRERPAAADSVAALCARACEVAACGDRDSSACSRDCLLRGAEAGGARCDRAHAALLACVSQATPNCASACTGAACLGSPRVRGCELEAKRLDGCLAPCRDEGVSQKLTRKSGQPAEAVGLEVERSGCGTCSAEPASGAPPGAACQAASVCSRHCCECRGSAGRHHVRACVAGKCAPASRACALATELVVGLCTGAY